MPNLVLTRVLHQRCNDAASLIASAAFVMFGIGAFASFPALGQVAAPSSTAASAASGTTALESVTVTGYRQLDASPAAKIQAPNRDLPITVDQIPQALIADRRSLTIDEAIDTIAGVRLIPGYPGSSGYLIRGFFESYNTLIDGFRANQALGDVQTVERLDVLKGPPSVLFGTQSAGGVLNLVTKSAQLRAFDDVDLTGGSYGEKRANVDSNRSFADGRVALRVNATYEDAGNFRDFVNSRTRALSLAAAIKLSDRDTLTLKTSYQKFDYTYYSDFPLGAANDSQFLNIPISRSLGEPGLPKSHSHDTFSSFELKHDLGGGWQLRSALGYNDFHVDHGLSRVYYPTLESDGRTLDRMLEEGPQSTTALTVQEEIYGKFDTGAFRHAIVAGFEYDNQKYPYVDNFAPIASLDIFNPVYGAQPGPVSFGYAGRIGDHGIGLYAQDLVTFDRWKFLAGLRYDRNNSFADSQDETGAVTGHSVVQTNRASPRLGAMYDAWAGGSVYVSWSRSFLPNTGQSASGAAFAPATGEQYEVGLKQDLLDKRLSFTAAAYQIKRNNVLTADPANPGFYIAAGQQRSRGVELSLAGSILPAWQVFATYAYTNAVVTRDDSLPIGQQLAGVPRHAASIWSEYDFANGAPRGFEVGGGLTFSSKREATLPSTFQLSSYARLDVLAAFRFDDTYKLSLNVKNLNGRRYYDTDGGYALRPGAPRTFLLTLHAGFR